jgi:hypothetical protein
MTWLVDLRQQVNNLRLLPRQQGHKDKGVMDASSYSLGGRGATDVRAPAPNCCLQSRTTHMHRHVDKCQPINPLCNTASRPAPPAHAQLQAYTAATKGFFFKSVRKTAALRGRSQGGCRTCVVCHVVWHNLLHQRQQVINRLLCLVTSLRQQIQQ